MLHDIYLYLLQNIQSISVFYFVSSWIQWPLQDRLSASAAFASQAGLALVAGCIFTDQTDGRPLRCMVQDEMSQFALQLVQRAHSIGAQSTETPATPRSLASSQEVWRRGGKSWVELRGRNHGCNKIYRHSDIITLHTSRFIMKGTSKWGSFSKELKT